MSGGWGGGTELARQSLLTVLMNFGFLVFDVTEVRQQDHDRPVRRRRRRAGGDRGDLSSPGKRLAEWIAVFRDGR